MKLATLFLTAAIAALVLLSSSAAHAANVTCLVYAAKAVRAAQTNARTCRHAGARWSLDFNEHYQGCRRSSQSQRDQEEAARRDAQASCRLGTISQALVNGDPVPVNLQKDLGLVSVSGRCSGTLLNRYWVLTAVHCITTTGTFGPGAPTSPLDQITVTAAWSPKSFPALNTIRYDNVPLCPPGQQCPRGVDVALILLRAEAAELGGTIKLLYAGSPRAATDASLQVRSFGRGLATLAQEGPPQAAGTFGNAYRTGVFPIREGSDIDYFVTPNPSSQIIGGGDSGGPDFVLSPSGSLLGILGVHSKCWFDYAMGRGDLPNGNADWQWAKDIWVCKSDAIHTIRDNILNTIANAPPVKTGPGGMAERGIDSNPPSKLESNPGPIAPPAPPNLGDVTQPPGDIAGSVPRQPYGAIGDKYAKLGGPNGALGQPTGGEGDAPHGGRCQAFRHGTICWHPQIGEAFAVWGSIHDKWSEVGRVEFGYPITDERVTSDGRGRFNHFRGMQYPGKPEGSIFWSPQTGAHAIYGAIRDAWAQQGWERGPLGYPTSDEHQDGKYRRVNFERGFIRWAPDTGIEIRQ